MEEEGHPIHVLMMNRDISYFQHVKSVLSEKKPVIPTFEVVGAFSLPQAYRLLGKVKFDVILLDNEFQNGNGSGIHLFHQVQKQAINTPIIVLAESQDTAQALLEMHEGAQDYFVKWECHPERLMFSILFSIERNRVRQSLHQINNELERRVVERTKQLRNLTEHLQSIREDERTSLAREIHDELGQELTAIKMYLYQLDKSLAPTNSQAVSQETYGHLHSMSQLIDQTIQSVRKIASELRPSLLDHLGLAEAIEWETEEFQKRTGIFCFHSLAREIVPDRNHTIAIFRIFQEIMTNITRHSQATKVEVRLSMEKRFVVLEVSDNGKGITEDQIQDPNSLGILGMRERALYMDGEMTFEKGKGQHGTKVVLKIPYRQSEEALCHASGF
ncbi:MAG: response regulator [Deltaproteobacteria bacterium]|nr:response regulator [Deltaproteobacteria bacterium]